MARARSLLMVSLHRHGQYLHSLNQWDHGSHIGKTEGLRCGIEGVKERLEAFTEPGIFPP